MAPPIEALIADLDPDASLADFLAALTLLGFDATTWEAGDLAYDLTDGAVSWFCGVWNTNLAPAIRAQFLRHASGSNLSEVAWSKYNRPRTAATFAEGSIVVESRGVGVGTIAAGTFRTPANAAGKTFTNTADVFLPLWSGAGAFSTVTMQVRADEAGAASNTAADALPTYPTPPRASPIASLYVQSNAALLGSDEEEDDILKLRCQLAAAEEGLSPLAKIEAVARDPIGAMRRARLPIPATWPHTVNVTRVRVVETGAGAFTVYLASPSGAAAGDTVTADSDVYVCNAAIQLLAVPPGGSCTVAPAVEVPIDFGVMALWVRRESNVTKGVAEATAGADLQRFFRTLPIGGERLIAGGQGYVILEHVLSVATQGPGVFKAAAQLVSGDVALAPGEVATPTYTPSAAIITQGASA
jgi:hypothetical protein